MVCLIFSIVYIKLSFISSQSVSVVSNGLYFVRLDIHPAAFDITYKYIEI